MVFNSTIQSGVETRVYPTSSLEQLYSSKSISTLEKPTSIVYATGSLNNVSSQYVMTRVTVMSYYTKSHPAEPEVIEPSTVWIPGSLNNSLTSFTHDETDFITIVQATPTQTDTATDTQYALESTLCLLYTSRCV